MIARIGFESTDPQGDAIGHHTTTDRQKTVRAVDPRFPAVNEPTIGLSRFRGRRRPGVAPPSGPSPSGRGGR